MNTTVESPELAGPGGEGGARPTPAEGVGLSDPPRDFEPELAAGTRVGEYTITGRLGRGGMAVVYAALHPVIEKRVAIKVLSAAHARDPGTVRRFVDEARAVNRIQHPHIVDIFAFGRLPDGRHYHVMELLDGESLAARLARGALDVDEIRTVMAQACSALDAVHQAGVVHRDLKPDNVFLSRGPGATPVVKLLDFGVAKLVDVQGAGVTQNGAALGTPLFMSPEQCLGQSVDARADVYALGVILYRLFSGVLPFDGRTAAEVVYRHMAELPAAPSRRARAPGPVTGRAASLVDKLILECLDKDPARRPDSAGEVWCRLEGALAGQVIAGARQEGGRAARTRAIVLVAAAAVAVATLGLVYRPEGSTPSPRLAVVSASATPGTAPAAVTDLLPSPVESQTRKEVTGGTGVAKAAAVVDGPGPPPSKRAKSRTRTSVATPPPAQVLPDAAPPPPTRARSLGLLEENPFRPSTLAPKSP